MMKIRNVADLGAEIRLARKAMGLTQGQLAGASGVGESFVYNIEHGKETAEIGKALHVARMAGIDLYIERRG